MQALFEISGNNFLQIKKIRFAIFSSIAIEYKIMIRRKMKKWGKIQKVQPKKHKNSK